MKFEFHCTKRSYLKTKVKDIATLSVLGTVWEQKELDSVLSNNDDVSVLINKIKSFSGFFSIVYQKKDDLFASVDHIRSHPLFYGQKDGKLFLCDEAGWVKEQVGDNTIEQVARDEFQLTGYVTGKDTLCPNVKQLQAGECLSIIDGKLSLYRYYTFKHSEPKKYVENELVINLDKISKGSIARLIEYACGRQIVIPLSGGFDSRLIATLLKKTRYPNIICFTYGINGNKDAIYSKIVAEALELPWYFVEYTKQLWKEAYNTEEAKEYEKLAFNYVSLPHFQDWLAVKKLKEKNIIARDAVFVPGHSGDMIAGSHLPKYIYEDIDGVRNKLEALNEILRRHYCLAPYQEIKTKKEIFVKRVLDSLREFTITSTKDFADACEYWNWQERQAKFICNSIRVYEFFGYDWWIPLWDKPFVKFFENLPLQLRNHDWYKTYVDLIFKDISCSKSQKLNNIGIGKKKISLSQKMSVKNEIVKKVINNVFRLFTQNSLNALEGRYDEKIYNSMIRKGYKSNGIFAHFVLREIEESKLFLY